LLPPRIAPDTIRRQDDHDEPEGGSVDDSRSVAYDDNLAGNHATFCLHLNGSPDLYSDSDIENLLPPDISASNPKTHVATGVESQHPAATVVESQHSSVRPSTKPLSAGILHWNHRKQRQLGRPGRHYSVH
jgi:hypothetical protein